MELRGWTSSSLLAFSLERWSRTSAGPREARTGAAVRPGQTSRNRCRDFSWIRLLQDGYRMCIQDPVQLTPGHVGSQQPVCTRRAHASATAALSPRSGTALRTFACPVFTSPAIPLGPRVMLVYPQLNRTGGFRTVDFPTVFLEIFLLFSEKNKFRHFFRSQIIFRVKLW